MTPSALRIVFAGTPLFAARHLEVLLESAHELVAVYTQPDRPAGRGKKPQSSPVKQLAAAAGIPIFQPISLRDETQQQRLAALEPDVLVVVAYGLILPKAVLDIPAQGCINVHGSLLPRWRGAAPIARAIESGDELTGITIMKMDVGLDTGAMLATRNCPIGPNTTAASLHDELAEEGCGLLLEVLADLPSYLGAAKEQDDSEATYAHKIMKPEAEIDWNRSADTLERTIRALNPAPGCYTTMDGGRLKIWQAAVVSTDIGKEAAGTITRADREGIRVSCGAGELSLERLQMPGGKILSAEQLLNAKSQLFSPGTVLGQV
jgi:methionyl-tRNA formyltransferase